MLVSFDSLEPAQLSPRRAAAYAARARHEVAIAVGHSTIAVRFSHPSAAAAFAVRFGDMPGDGPPAAVAYAVAFPDEAYFWLSPDRARRWPHRINDHLLVFFTDILAMHEYLTTSADVGFHAAVIAKGSVVAALVGRSTAGKTTTAIAAARNGFALYSDERCILQEGLVVPFLRAITVREGARSALLGDAASGSSIDTRLRKLPAQGEAAIRPRALLAERAGGPPRRLGAMFVIEGRAATPFIEPCSVYAVLPTLLESMASRDRGLDRAARLIGVLRDVPLYRLRLGTPDATAKSIERTLDEAYPSTER
jgi:hypothetical protein